MNISKEEIIAQGIVSAEDYAVMEDYTPVSYTHLDVYKRQEREHRTFNPIDKLKEEHTPASNAQDMNHSFTQEQVEDVYKRQEQG